MNSSSEFIADTVLLDGFVYTVDERMPNAQALAVRNGTITAIEDTETIRKYCDSSTTVIELNGRMVMPGLVDGHCHPTKGAIAQLFSCHFEFDASPDQVAAAVELSIEKDPAAEFIIGGRWDSDFFTRFDIPSPRQWLDNVSRDKAVYLRDDSGHNGWANSKALEIAGIGAASGDPDGGKIIREPGSREPNGMLLEQADSMARHCLPDWNADQYRAGVREMARIANGYGITGVTDADANEALLKAYRESAEANELSVHVVASISTPYGHRENPLDYDLIENLRDRYACEHVDTRFAKIYLDGVPTAARTAAMLEPYVAHANFSDGFNGILHIEERLLAQDIAALESRGFTVKLHTAGDRSIRVALNAIEDAHAISGRCDLRHELAHAGFVHQQDIPRFKQLNVVADLSPYIWHPSPIMNSVRQALGERGEKYWPIKDLLDAGANVLAGSDWPAAVSSMDPWKGLEALVTRSDPSGKTPGSLWPEQAISLSQTLKIFTLDGAEAQRRAGQCGSLVVGKSADLIVLNQNLFEVPANDIADTLVDLTMFDGRIVFQK